MGSVNVIDVSKPTETAASLTPGRPGGHFRIEGRSPSPQMGRPWLWVDSSTSSCGNVRTASGKSKPTSVFREMLSRCPSADAAARFWLAAASIKNPQCISTTLRVNLPNQSHLSQVSAMSPCPRLPHPQVKCSPPQTQRDVFSFGPLPERSCTNGTSPAPFVACLSLRTASIWPWATATAPSTSFAPLYRRRTTGVSGLVGLPLPADAGRCPLA